MAGTPRQRRGKTILVISQTFVPDPAAVGQQIADLTIELARRGHRVGVYTANRGYEDTSRVYPAREDLHGVDVRRLALSSFGKRSILTRLIGTASFLIQSIFLCLFTPNLAGIFFSTSPPLIGLAASLASVVRRVPIIYWAMDLNPDQLIAMGKIKPTSFTARALEGVNRFILKRSNLVVALDRYMADRLRARGVSDDKMLVMPPWPHEAHLQSDPGENPFRVQHGLQGKFVIMYSGNHSPANPLQTLLDAAVRFKDDDSLRFLFVGGGGGKKVVEAYIRDHALHNALSLPYQPLENLKHSLTAADVHVVSLGSEMVGIIHPCKIYGAMAAGKPILYLGPAKSHITDLLDRHAFGWQTTHGDVDGAIATINAIRATPRERLDAMGRLGAEVLRDSLSQVALCGRLTNAVEQTFHLQA
jgi:colanic acid biosynthesis glycosyl transferase WcaI